MTSVGMRSVFLVAVLSFYGCQNPTDPDDVVNFDEVVDVTASTTRFLAVGVAGSSMASVVRLFASTDGRAWQVDSTIPLPPGERFVPSSVIAVGTPSRRLRLTVHDLDDEDAEQLAADLAAAVRAARGRPVLAEVG